MGVKFTSTVNKVSEDSEISEASTYDTGTNRISQDVPIVVDDGLHHYDRNMNENVLVALSRLTCIVED